jgi:putative transposase
MARKPRSLLAGYCYHGLTRGNARALVFHGPKDYRAFLQLMDDAQAHCAMPILAVCIMPNHFHVVTKPLKTKDMSRWFHWLLTTQVRRYHKAHGTTGRIWQGRFKSFPIQHDGHLLNTMRYVERNALRSGLVGRAEQWTWGSLNWRVRGRVPAWLVEPPGGLPGKWTEWVNTPQSAAEEAALRLCVNRQRPYGDESWVQATAAHLGLESSLRPRGRPKRTE